MITALEANSIANNREDEDEAKINDYLALALSKIKTKAFNKEFQCELPWHYTSSFQRLEVENKLKKLGFKTIRNDNLRCNSLVISWR